MDFRVVNYVGVLFRKDADFHITDEDKGEFNLTAELRLMAGGKVQLTMQHAPPNPPFQERWGGGCCMWESSGRCPSGHHDRPGYLYQVGGVGDLHEVDGSWVISRDGSKDLPIYLNMLEGHRCRIAIVPSVLPGDIPDPVKDADPNNLGDLMERAEQLKAFIAEANEIGKGKK